MVMLTGQIATWTSFNARVSEGSTWEPLLFLIYINDLFDYLWSNVKIYRRYIFVFSNPWYESICKGT